MNHAAMLELSRAAPFTPFDVITSAGQVHRVVHPEFTILTKTRVVISDPEEDHVARVLLLHLTEAQTTTASEA